MNLLKPEHRGSVSVILTELLMNAIEHGNCDISFDDKSAWLNQGKSIHDLIVERQLDPEIAAKKVTFSYTINPKQSSFTIKDEGNGFNHQQYDKLSASLNPLERHGRGITMVKHYAENLSYNDTGNECTFVIHHLEHENNKIPAIFRDADPITYEDGEVVFTEGEQSDDLYYIVSGCFKILVNDQEISTLSSDDIFLGEMSFLLNHKRSATVVSNGPTKLIKISKRLFVNAIKQNPHYGIFLARLLAQRLNRVKSNNTLQ